LLYYSNLYSAELPCESEVLCAGNSYPWHKVDLGSWKGVMLSRREHTRVKIKPSVIRTRMTPYKVKDLTCHLAGCNITVTDNWTYDV